MSKNYLKPPTTVSINLLEVIKYIKDLFKKKDTKENKNDKENERH